MSDSRYGAAVIWRKVGGKLEVIKMPHRNENGSVLEKFPGGGKEESDKDVLDAARRETLFEVGLSFPRKSAKWICTRKVPDDKTGGVHKQVFFAVPFESCSGEFRKGLLREDDLMELGDPSWVDAQFFMDFVFSSHRVALESFLYRKGMLPKPGP